MKMQTINKSILKTTYVFLTLFIIMILYLLFFTVFKSGDIIDNSYNKRIETLNNFTYKGNIYTDNGEVIAYTDRESEERVYPYNDLFSHVIGYTGHGSTGLESTYNYEMLCSDTNIFGKFSNEITGKKNDGNSINTTLNIELQQACKSALSTYSGAIIVMNPKNGDVLSMVSGPSFDPNTLDSEFQNLSQNDNAILLNRATQGLYTPGSTFKIFSLYEYLKEHRETYLDYRFTCRGKVDFSDYTIHCADYVWHGDEDLYSSFANSCNTSFVNLAKDIDVNGLLTLCKDMLFNEKMPLEIDYNSSIFSLDENSDDFMISQTVIGQGKTLMTPMHLSMIMAAIENDGVLMQPRFVTSIVNPNGEIIEKYDAKEYKTLMPKEDSMLLKSFLLEVVKRGTASSLYNSNYVLMGKTGTAELDKSDGNVNSWFAGILETGEEAYVITVVIENVNGNYTPAKDIAKQIIDKIQSN